MKRKYYVNKQAQANRDHEVHVEDCEYMPSSTNKQYLGEFSGCAGAVIEAKKYFDQVNGCKTCCKPCHTQ